MSRFRGALLFNFASQQTTLIISFISIAVIARFVTPAEIGVFAVANVLVVMAIEIRSFGVTQYLVREPSLSEETKSTAMGLMLITCWILAFITFASAPFVADFYGEPDIRDLLWIMSPTFVIAPFASIPYAMMVREVRFDLIFRIRLLCVSVRVVTSIALVIAGFSYFGLAWGVLVGSIVEFVAISYYDQSRSWCKPSLAEWRNVIGFGAFSSGANLLTRTTESLPDLVLGKLASMADVGYFSRGLGLMNFLDQIASSAVKPITLPYLSEINRTSGDVSKAYLRCVVLHGVPLIRLFFGDQWDVAAPIASILSIWAIFKTAHGFLPSALIATGNEKSLLKKEALVTVSRFLLLVYSAQYGLVAVAYSVAFSGFLEFAICSYIASTRLSLKYTNVMRALMSNLILALTCYASAYLCILYLGETDSSLKPLLLVAAVTTAVWLVTLRYLNHELWQIVVGLYKEVQLKRSK